MGGDDYAFATLGSHFAWRGDTTTATLGTEYVNFSYSCADGADDDLLTQILWPGAQIKLLYLPSGASAWTTPAGGLVGVAGNDPGWLERGPGSSRQLALAAGNGGAIWATADYRAAQPTLRSVGFTGGSIAALTDGHWYLGSRTGIVKITDLLGSPSGSIVAGTGETIGRIRSDPSHTYLAARKLGTVDVHYYNGTAWSLIPGPAAAVASGLADTVGVLPA